MAKPSAHCSPPSKYLPQVHVSAGSICKEATRLLPCCWSATHDVLNSNKASHIIAGLTHRHIRVQSGTHLALTAQLQLRCGPNVLSQAGHGSDVSFMRWTSGGVQDTTRSQSCLCRPSGWAKELMTWAICWPNNHCYKLHIVLDGQQPHLEALCSSLQQSCRLR